jgi:hypothetical protein
MLVVQPLQAADGDRIVVRIGDESCGITADRFQGTIDDPIEVYDGDQTNSVPVENGALLADVIRQAQEICGISGEVKGVELIRKDGSKYLVEPDADIVFWFDGTTPQWQRRQKNAEDENSRDAGVLASGENKLVITGTENELAKVTLSSTPKDVGVGDTVTFKVSVKNAPKDAELSYTWDFGDKDDERTTEPETSHVYKKKGSYTASVLVSGDELRGADTLDLDIEKESQQQDDADGSNGDGTENGDGGGNNGGTTPGPGSSGGNPGFNPGPGPSFPTTPTPPSTDPALPPPDVPPPSDTTPTNPDDFGTTTPSEPGEEVTGIVISTVAAPNAGGDQPNAAAEQDKPQEEEAGVDWKVSTGAILAGLLLILGGLREHMPTRQLLPKAS